MDDAKNNVFVFSRNKFSMILENWYDRITLARKVLKPRSGFDKPNLWDLGSAILETSGMTIEQSEEWGEIANGIREYVGADNLCEVLVDFDSTI